MTWHAYADQLGTVKGFMASNKTQDRLIDVTVECHALNQGIDMPLLDDWFIGHTHVYALNITLIGTEWKIFCDAHQHLR
jgi:hypothetical protein